MARDVIEINLSRLTLCLITGLRSGVTVLKVSTWLRVWPTPSYLSVYLHTHLCSHLKIQKGKLGSLCTAKLCSCSCLFDSHRCTFSSFSHSFPASVFLSLSLFGIFFAFILYIFMFMYFKCVVVGFPRVARGHIAKLIIALLAFCLSHGQVFGANVKN